MGIEFIIWDVAGTWGNRSLWHQIAQGAAGVICVIDSTDLDQIEEAKGHLWRMFEHYDVQEKECPLLVFANKQDRLGALSVAEVKDKLELETRSQGRRWHIRGSIATTGDGLMGGMEWMATQLKGTSKNIGPPKRRVLMVGVAGCGKTTLLYHLHLGKTIATVPTLGYNVETLTINGIELTIWDVGGDWNYRNGLWRHYIPQADGIIFVVDSSDESQIDAVKTVLCELYRDFESQLKRSVLLVFANKQDRLNALSVAEVKDRIGIERETMQAEGRRWHVQGSIANTGDGLLEGMVWMTMQMN
ncbi:hypothetical protein BGZ88_007152 [Linnemannia elongata]|nr:hypothetical protein BGZ88_007152 [Linnemannia elongata]